MSIFCPPEIFRVLPIGAALVAGLLVLPGCTAENARKINSEDKPPEPVTEVRHTFTGGFPSELEQRQVIRWLMLNNLNKYGDPLGTMYSGSTPLYDEVTGETVSRYDYLVKKHPGKPWLKIQIEKEE